MQEAEADVLGVRLACAADFNPDGLLIFIAKLREQDQSGISFLQTHPSPSQRMEYLRRAASNCPSALHGGRSESVEATSSSQDLTKRADLAANRVMAVGSLRVLNTACITYASTYSGGYPRSLADLGASRLIDGELATGLKRGYLFTYVPSFSQSRPGVIDFYTIVAGPKDRGETGSRSFFTDQSGVIRNQYRPVLPVRNPLLSIGYTAPIRAKSRNLGTNMHLCMHPRTKLLSSDIRSGPVLGVSIHQCLPIDVPAGSKGLR